MVLTLSWRRPLSYRNQSANQWAGFYMITASDMKGLRSLSDIALSDTKKLQLGNLERAIWKKRYRVRLKNIALLQNCKMKSKRIIVFLKCKKCFFLRKLTKMSNLIVCLLEIPQIFICIGLMQVAFLSED